MGISIHPLLRIPRFCSFLKTSALRAAAKLKVSDAIHNACTHAASTPAAVAAAAAASSFVPPTSARPGKCFIALETIARTVHVPPTSLLRLLRALAGLGIFEESTDEGHWAQTLSSDLLREDHPQSMSGVVKMFGGPQMSAMGQLHRGLQQHGVPSEKAAFEMFYGSEFWAYHSAHAEDMDEFSQGMTSLAKIGTERMRERGIDNIHVQITT